MSLPRIASMTLAMAGTFLLSACIPFPHDFVLSPAIDGAVQRNGQPVAGARLYVEGRKDCSWQGEPLATSDANGAFHIPQRQKWGYVIPMDPPPGPPWRLCIAEGDRRYQGWYEESLTHYRGITLGCDLESAPRTWSYRGMYGARRTVTGLCRSRADEESGELTPVPAVPAPR